MKGGENVFTADDYKVRLARAASTAITDTPDGRPWYKGRAVCQALGLDPSSVYPKVRREYKYSIVVGRRKYVKTKELYLSRTGVETLIMLRGGLPLRETLAALDAATPM